MTDTQFEMLSSVSLEIAAARVATDREQWVGSPFEWILNLSSRSKGAVLEQIIAEWCTRNGLDVRRSSNSQADRVINGQRVEIKLSTLWSSGVYKFQQIRDQEYDQLLCMGLSPNVAHAWLIPKSVLHQYVIGHMGQHTGASGGDTAWLQITPGMAPSWLEPYGPDLETVIFLLRDSNVGS